MTAQGDTSYKWKLVVLLFFTGALNYADRTAISAVFPLLRQDLQMSDLQLASIGTVFLWTYAACSPLSGILADRYSRARLITLSLTMWSVVTALAGFVTNSSQLLFLRVLLGIAECAYLPAAIALIADHHPPSSRATGNGIHVSGLTFGTVTGGAAAGYLGEHYGWRPMFFILGGIGIALALATFLYLRDGPTETGPANRRESQPVLPALARLFRIGGYWVLLIEAMLLAIGLWVFLNWLPLYFRETYGISLASAGFLGTIAVQGASVLGILLAGPISDRLARTSIANRMLMQSVCYLLAAPFLLVFAGKAAIGVLSACMFGYGLFRSLGSANDNPLTCDILPPNLRSTAVGFANCLNCFAGGAGVLVAGALKAEFGLSGAFIAISVILVAASAITFAGFRLLPWAKIQYSAPADLRNAPQ